MCACVCACVCVREVKAKVQQEYLMAMDSLSSSQGLFKQWLNNEDPLESQRYAAVCLSHRWSV